MTGRVGLTEQEEQLLLLLEGDISDIAIDTDLSDEENLLENLQAGINETLNIITAGDTAGTGNVSFEIEDEDSFDEEDNIPLSNYAKKCSVNRKRKAFSWRKNDIDLISSDCNIQFTTTGNCEPFSYF